MRPLPNGKTPSNTQNNIDEIEKNGEITDPEYDMAHMVSDSDFTGMMYVPPQSEEEYESYMDLFNIPAGGNPDKPDKSEKTQNKY